MRGRPRKDVIREDEVGVYHVWTRCVRRAWLCGIDPLTGNNYEHRKDWIRDRLEELARIFAVDACVFAILSNHFHLLVRNRPDLAAQWSEEEVVRRWWQLCPDRRDEEGHPAAPTDLEIAVLLANHDKVATWRKQLSSISYFMQYLNQYIANRANREDGVTGHFVDGRFGCRALLDEGAILVAALYIDLNELRAQLAATPEDSRYSSAYLRILRRIRRQLQAAEQDSAAVEDQCDETGDWLCPLNERDVAPLLGPNGVESVTVSQQVLSQLKIGREITSPCPFSLEGEGRVRGHQEHEVVSRLILSELDESPEAFDPAAAVKAWRHGFLDMTVDAYLKLLDWNARRLVSGKSGAMDPSLPPILERLGLTASGLGEMVENFERWFHGAVGSPRRMADEAARRGRQWLQGVKHARAGFS